MHTYNLSERGDYLLVESRTETSSIYLHKQYAVVSSIQSLVVHERQEAEYLMHLFSTYFTRTGNVFYVLLPDWHRNRNSTASKYVVNDTNCYFQIDGSVSLEFDKLTGCHIYKEESEAIRHIVNTAGFDEEDELFSPYLIKKADSKLICEGDFSFEVIAGESVEQFISNYQV